MPPSQPTARLRKRLDNLGLALSGLCALHCILSIVLVSALGLGGQVLLSPDVHRFGLAAAIVIAAAAIGWGMFRHRRLEPLIVSGLGLGLMCAALFAEHGTSEALLTIAGVALVALGHVKNLRLSH